MMGLKKISALIIAGMIGITYTCGGVPIIYAIDAEDTTYTVESKSATVKEERTATQLPMETATQGAVTETNVPQESMLPGKTEPPSKGPTKEPTIPVHTAEIIKTESPIATAMPKDTDVPLKTMLPTDVTMPPISSPAATTRPPDSSVNEEYCRITYQLNGGTNHKNNPAKVKKKGVSVVLNAPKKAKYTFAGWYTDAKYINKVTTVGNTSLSFLTLYAKWKKVTVKQATFSAAKKKGANSILVKVKKENGVKGFEYVYAKDPSFRRKYRLRTKKNPKTLSKLTRKKTYYIKVRAYKLDSTGKKIYGIYSRIKKVKL